MAIEISLLRKNRSREPVRMIVPAVLTVLLPFVINLKNSHSWQTKIFGFTLIAIGMAKLLKVP